MMANQHRPAIALPDPADAEGEKIARVEIAGRTFWVEVQGDDLIEVIGDFTSAERGGVVGELADARFLAPVERHNHVINLMGNFTERTDRRGPGIFVKPMNTISGYGDAIVWPRDVPNINMEAELAVVIGKTCKGVSEADALDHVFGYTVTNDVTSFGVINEEGFDSLSMRFKMYDTFMPIGPWITRGVADADRRQLTSRLNGKTIQDVSLTKMDFNVAQTVAWISGVMTMYPGDIISMGTPLGFVDMAEGDVVECEVAGIGKLINHVVREG